MSLLPRPQTRSDLRRVESAPLLSGEPDDDRRYLNGTVETEAFEEPSGLEDGDNTSPLPRAQIFLLCLMRMASPIAFSQIFPYINQMVKDLGVTDHPSQVGYYSGVVDSVFSFIQLFTCVKIGVLADRMGRKPILVLGLSGVVISTVLFGLSKTFIWALATRAVAGALSGNTMIINSAVGDITDETNQAQAYAWIGLAYNIASILGPAIGGSFAVPEKTFPKSFGTIKLLREFPYLLPCIITSLVGFVALIFCVLFFKETVARRPVLKHVASYYSSQDVSSEVMSAKELTAWQLALDPVLFPIFRAFFFLNILNTAVSVVFNLFAYTPIEHGGLSRSPGEIGLVIAFSGVISGVLEVVFLPPLQRRFGTTSLLKWMMALWPIVFLLFPLTHLVARLTMDAPNGGHEHAKTSASLLPAGALMWFCISMLLLLHRLAVMAWPVHLILTRRAVPSDEILGAVFGLQQLVGAFARAIGPAFISSIFAFSKEHDVLGGNFVWLVMIALSLLGLWSTVSVQDGRDDGFEDDMEE